MLYSGKAKFPGKGKFIADRKIKPMLLVESQITAHFTLVGAHDILTSKHAIEVWIHNYDLHHT